LEFETSGIELVISVVVEDTGMVSASEFFWISELGEAVAGRSPSTGEAIARGTESIANFFGNFDLSERSIGNPSFTQAEWLFPEPAGVWQSYRVSNSSDGIGKWLTILETAELLGIPKGKVNRLLEEKTLVAVKRDGQLMIPAELIVDGEPLPSLRGTIIMLEDAGYSIEESVHWLFTHSEVLGQTPLQSLLEGKKAPVRRLAQMLDI